MKKAFLMLLLAAGASVAMAQSQKLISGSTSFRATLPEFSYDGKAQIFTINEDGLYDDTKKETITFYSNDFTAQGELTINAVGCSTSFKHEERAYEGGYTRGYTGAWETHEDNGYTYAGIIKMYLQDFDQSCDDFRDIYLSQTIFNSDDKYEYLLPVLATESGSHEEDRDGDGQIDVKDSWTDAIVTGLQVVSETGAVIQTINFPSGYKARSLSKSDVSLIKINGKLYLSISVRDADGSDAILLCSIGTAASGGASGTRGDVNGDGVVNAADVVKVVDIISGQ